MTVGRPKASSRETLAEAACELFLEKGFAATSIVDITSRAGVSRSSFFNYFGAKSDILWGAFDERLAAAFAALAGSAPVDAALCGIADGFTPDSLALGIANASVMGIDDELERERAVRQIRLGRVVAERLRRDGAAVPSAEVRGAAYAGAVLAAVWRWADAGPGVTALDAVLRESLDAVSPAPGAVRQLRLVVTAPDFDEALAFYRDVVGLEQAEAYEADGGARVVILEAGRATLELANTAQVAFIDRVETDGDAPSDRLRVAFEVGDTGAAVDRLATAGAAVEASARVTPWRSVNARLRGPADLQLTLFQELGDQ